MSRFYCEPTLDELFADNAARLLMASDGVKEHAVRDLLARVTHARKGRRTGAPAPALVQLIATDRQALGGSNP